VTHSQRTMVWQLGRQSQGLCITCGRPRDCGSTVCCYRCLVKKRLYARRIMGWKPRRTNGVGRPQLARTRA
jgi:hypothetical protein